MRTCLTCRYFARLPGERVGPCLLGGVDRTQGNCDVNESEVCDDYDPEQAGPRAPTGPAEVRAVPRDDAPKRWW